MSILARTSLRYILRHPWQFGLAILGVALGVAVVVAIDLANASARSAFTLSTEAVAGRATHQVVGGPGGLDEALYRELRVELGLRAAAPVVSGYAVAPELDERTFQILGVDPLAEAPFRNFFGPAAAGSGGRSGGDNTLLATLLTTPGTLLMAAPTAERYGLAPGSEFALRIGSATYQVQVAGLLEPEDRLSARAVEGILIADIATAQELLGSIGKLSRIDLILPDAATANELAAVLPPGAELTRPAARTNALEQMTRAFELNLTALSLLALIVGMFLIYNTMTFSVVQRRGLLATLRCVGATRGQVFGLVLVEALLISIVGSLLGLGLGVVLGRGLVQLVTQTITDLYFVVTVRSLGIEPLVLLKGVALGIGATLLAAAAPALEATTTPPRAALRRSSIEDRARRLAPTAALGGLLLLATAAGLLALPGVGAAPLGGLLTAFAALFLVVIGCALLTPAALIGLMAIARPLLGAGFGLLGRMAARDVVAALSRTAVAAAALMIAVSVTIGVGLMVGSFRQTVVDWLAQSLIADIYVSPPSTTATRVDSTIDPALVAAFGQAPGVAAQTVFRSVEVTTPSGPVTLVATDGSVERGQRALRFAAGGGAETWQAYVQGGLLISEPLAYRTGLGVGDTLRLRTDRGERDFPIAGVYYDYTSDRGVIRIADNAYRTYWDDDAISSFALYAAPGVDPDELADRLQAAFGAEATGLVISSNRGLRESTLAVFDRTFAITAVLQLLATVVAFIGILSALMALQLERARELGVLRATGLTPRQLWGAVLTQTGLMGAAAGLLAMPVGLVLALVLIYVINRRSFGWTLNLALDPALFGQALLVALVAALLAGVYPAWRMGRTSPALALREE